jgi:hypothetical protein
MYATVGLVPLARKGWRSFQPAELRQACAFSTLSKAVTMTRFGASPSSAVTFPPRTRNFPPNAASSLAPYHNDEARIIADHVIDAAMCGYEYSGLAKILNVFESELTSGCRADP